MANLKAVYTKPLSSLDDLGQQLAFYIRALVAAPRAAVRYQKEVLRILAEVTLGSGSLAVIGGTVGVIVSMLLNRLTLQPGEAAYLGAGIIHAHMSGMCVEVMVNSDNVLRAGLTPKHLDPAGVVASIDAEMSRLARVSPELVGTSTDVFEPGEGEFGLAVCQTSQADRDGVELPEIDARILVCTGGEVELTNAHGETLRLTRGSVMYAGPEDGALRVRGTGEVAQLRGQQFNLVVVGLPEQWVEVLSQRHEKPVAGLGNSAAEDDRFRVEDV